MNSVILSYKSLRKAIGYLSITLPIILMVGGLIANLKIESSISSYYYTNMQDFFSGILIGIGIFLITYKGYSCLDNIITTFSGISIILIILFPCNGGGVFLMSEWLSSIFHLASAGIFFLLLAYNSYFLFTKSSGEVTKNKLIRNKVYRSCGIILLVCLIIITLISLTIKIEVIEKFRIILILESVMLSAFGVSWLIKGETIFKD